MIFPDLKYKINTSNPQGEIDERTPYLKNIKVFNKDYVLENLEIENHRAETIIIIGEENREISAQIGRR